MEEELIPNSFLAFCVNQNNTSFKSNCCKRKNKLCDRNEYYFIAFSIISINIRKMKAKIVLFKKDPKPCLNINNDL